jgi:ABC-type phosphate/phosphonate transport system substrate-binding protein
VTKAALLFVILALPTMICACGKSNSQSKSPEMANDASKLCAAMKETGLISQCSVSDRDSSINVVIDTSDNEEARKACGKLAGKVAQLAANIPAKMKLEVFSPYRSDKELATCSLNAAANSSQY